MTFYFIALMTKRLLIRHMVSKHMQDWLWVSDNVIQYICFGSVDNT